MNDKDNIKKIFLAGIDRVLGYNAVKEYLDNNTISGDLNLVSIGKAGSSMALSALEHQSIKIKSGLVITKKRSFRKRFRKI